MIGNYNNVEDFLNDESFISFVYSIHPKDVANWNLWLNHHTAKKPLAEEAASILKAIQLKEIKVSEPRIATAEARIRDAIALNKKGEPAKVISIGRKQWYWSVAAVLIISLVFGLSYLFHAQEKKPQLATNYGQVKKIELPDGTEVVLNANSHITWEQTGRRQNREVWVKGEAFFHVKKTLHQDKFIVHTNAFDIEVTGTSFNVVSEDGKSSVILKEGSVKIHRPGEPEISMKPGDFVEFANNQIEKKKVVKDDYLAWTQNKLVFDNTKLSDVANIIKDHYGIDVKLEEMEPEEKIITGIMPNDNLDVLLEALEATQEFTINRSQNLIIISNKHN